MKAGALDDATQVREAGTPPEVPELVCGPRCRRTGRGEIWEARWASDEADGWSPGWPLRVRAVALPPGERGRGRALRIARAFVEVPHEHLVAAVDALPWRDGIVLVHEAAAVALTLRQVLERYGPLTAGQVVTLGLPLLDALAVLHDSGLMHGGASVDDVLVAPDGRPLLAGAGFAAVVGSAGSPTEDVQHLSDALRGAAGSDAAGALEPLWDAVAGGVSAAQAAAVLGGLASVEPLVPPPTAAVVRARRSRWRPRWRFGGRAWLVAAGVGGAFAGVAALGWSTTATPRGAAPPPRLVERIARAPAPAPVPSVAPAGPDWSSIVRALDSARSRAFEAVRPALLTDVDAPGSVALSEDQALMRQVSERGWRARNLRLRVRSVDLQTRQQDRTILRVADTLDPYVFVDSAGSVTRRVAGRGVGLHEITLRQGSSGWRIESVRDVTK